MSLVCRSCRFFQVVCPLCATTGALRSCSSSQCLIPRSLLFSRPLRFPCCRNVMLLVIAAQLPSFNLVDITSTWPSSPWLRFSQAATKSLHIVTCSSMRFDDGNPPKTRLPPHPRVADENREQEHVVARAGVSGTDWVEIGFRTWKELGTPEYIQRQFGQGRFLRPTSGVLSIRFVVT